MVTGETSERLIGTPQHRESGFFRWLDQQDSRQSNTAPIQARPLVDSGSTRPTRGTVLGGHMTRERLQDSGGIDRLAAHPARVIVTPLPDNQIHPLTRRDVQRVLSVLPAESTRDLRSVSLLHEQRTAAGHPILCSYRRPGFVRLHAVPRDPWRTGHLPTHVVADLLRYGARVDAGPDHTTLTWSHDALSLYFVVAVLLPGIARHRREVEGIDETAGIVRVLDEKTDPWIVSDLALAQWAAFISEGRTQTARA